MRKVVKKKMQSISGFERLQFWSKKLNRIPGLRLLSTGETYCILSHILFTVCLQKFVFVCISDSFEHANTFGTLFIIARCSVQAKQTAAASKTSSGMVISSIVSLAQQSKGLYVVFV
jgi:hypothetical protein